MRRGNFVRVQKILLVSPCPPRGDWALVKNACKILAKCHDKAYKYLY
jgi:hypothetical protein